MVRFVVCFVVLVLGQRLVWAFDAFLIEADSFVVEFQDYAVIPQAEISEDKGEVRHVMPALLVEGKMGPGEASVTRTLWFDVEAKTPWMISVKATDWPNLLMVDWPQFGKQYIAYLQEELG